jgi:glutamate synthase domain-containing protein 2/glutamate synthase domain-containing protein 1/glutamate synthase domain-containing protein 3
MPLVFFQRLFLKAIMSDHSSHCGVGFLSNLKKESSFQLLTQALDSLEKIEHRGGVSYDGKTGDGAGILTAIPYDIIESSCRRCAIGQLFLSSDLKIQNKCLEILEEGLRGFGLNILKKRDVPTCPEILSNLAKGSLPKVLQIIIERPDHCRTQSSYDKLLYKAKQSIKLKCIQEGVGQGLYFVSLSSRTIIYKMLGTSKQLREFYPDLKDPRYKTNYALFHRRFSTNTLPNWRYTQPFGLIAHNGEINTFKGNQSWSATREKALGLKKGEIITTVDSSDSNNLNEMVEALRYKSSLPNESEILAILMPPSYQKDNPYYQFWARGVEPWDGPALVTFCCGKVIGARLDRNGFRPCRWVETEDHFFLCSEAGAWQGDNSSIIKKGALKAGQSIKINVMNGSVNFLPADQSVENKGAYFDARLIKLDHSFDLKKDISVGDYRKTFSYEEEKNYLIPSIENGKEPVGSMGDTARAAYLSPLSRSLHDYFYQRFAQVTNPPLDYIREKSVTSLQVFLGRKPNILEPKELLPLKPAIKCERPILSLADIENIKNYVPIHYGLEVPRAEIDLYQDSFQSDEDFRDVLQKLADEAVDHVLRGKTIIILSDRKKARGVVYSPLLVISKIHDSLVHKGIRLRCTLVLETSLLVTSHELALCFSFGVAAICPYKALEFARSYEELNITPERKEENLIEAYTDGLLRIMAKMGISVFRSYVGSKLFDIVGLNKTFHQDIFCHSQSIIGGLTLREYVHQCLKESDEKENFHLIKEAGKKGERHTMTSVLSRKIHLAISGPSWDVGYQKYLEFSEEVSSNKTSLRSLMKLKKKNNKPSELDRKIVLKAFGTGAMSFGSISAKAQRDLIVAMAKIGGRSNSGEGGENPFHETEGISASVKQIASGRFGVTAKYLLLGNEIQLKIAQGAKPGEGGQLPGTKVGPEIAKARYAKEGTELISPPPMHDIYSIEDLKGFIYELKQLNPSVLVSVKLVSALNIGTIAMGVAKAGADIIQISGGEGGTGAANRVSMRHAGLPWEIGLPLAHQALVKSHLRGRVILRADGGLHSGRDIVVASMLGADEFDFGKMALIAEGCIMARICQKNTCPRGIATQDPKFLEKYIGSVGQVVRLFEYMAQEVCDILKTQGYQSLQEIKGQYSLIDWDKDTVKINGLDLSLFSEVLETSPEEVIPVPIPIKLSRLNSQIVQDVQKLKKDCEKVNTFSYSICSTDRAVLASLSGDLIKRKVSPELAFHFKGTAGQSFASYLDIKGHVYLEGEANDFVGKSLHRGRINISSPKDLSHNPHEQTLAGNCCLYGATGGELFVQGRVGDRFAVRNSGATAVVTGLGYHGCEYMTAGTVVILGEVSTNLGAGMSGGEIYFLKEHSHLINSHYVQIHEILKEDESKLRSLINSFNTIFDDDYPLDCLRQKFIIARPI